MSEAMVRLVAVEKSYGAVRALSPTSLDIAKGEFLTLLGPSGSGKTTLLNLIAGSVPPSSGSLWIAGRDVTRLPPNQRDLGMVFQNYALMPHMTVFENIAFPLKVRKRPASEIRKRVDEVLEVVRLSGYANRKPRELSGGQQQRIAIARCLVYDPALILMDEPLGALDKKLRDQLQLEIKRIHRTLGMTLLYVTHDQSEALVLSDRICLMNAGRVEQIGTPDELYFKPRTVFAADFLGESNILDVSVEDCCLSTPAGLRIAGVAVPASSSTAKIMIRPESFAIEAEHVAGDNRVAGQIDDIILAGGVIDLRVRLRDDTVLSVRRLTTQDLRKTGRGQPIALSVKASDVIVLE
jgi:putative spermidine/putrescine transport system ATP-binding protein